MALHFVEERAKHMFNTTSGLFFRARRILRKAIRGNEKLKKELRPALQAALESGDVDKGSKKFIKEVLAWTQEDKQVVEAEEDVVIAEWRTLKDFNEITTEFGSILEQLGTLENHAQNDHQRSLIKDLKQHLMVTQNELAEFLHMEADFLKNEFNVLLRQEKREHGVVQNFVWSYASQMSMMKKLWDERKMARKVLKEEHDIHDLTEKMAKIVRLATHEQDMDAFDKELKQLGAAQVHLARYFMGIREDFKLLLDNFQFIIKVLVNLRFEFDKEDEELKQILAHLHEDGFPDETWSTMNEKLNDGRHRIEEKDHDAVAAQRRMSRVVLGNVSAPN